MNTKMNIKKKGTKVRKVVGFLLAFTVVGSLFPTTALAAPPVYLAPIAVKVLDLNKEYDGTPLVPKVEFSYIPDNILSAKIIFDESKKITEPGSLTIVERDMWGHEVRNKDGEDVTGDWFQFPLMSFEPGTLMVTQRKVTVAADDKTMTAGEEIPALTATTVEGSFLEGDAPSYALRVDGDTDVPGVYDILLDIDLATYPDQGKYERCYDVACVAGKLTVNEPVEIPSDSDVLEDLEDPVIPDVADPKLPEKPVVPTKPVTPVRSIDPPIVELVVEPASEELVAPVEVSDAPAEVPAASMPPEASAPAAQAAPVVQIEEESAPLAQATEGQLAGISETTVIEDQEVPLAAPLAKSGWALWNLILAAVTGIIAAVLLFGYFMGKNHRRTEEQELRRKGAIRLSSIAVTLLAAVVFILTEDMSQSMVMVDQWTIWMAAIALVQAGAAFFSVKSKKDNDTMKMQPMNS